MPGMNKPQPAKHVRVLAALCDGPSMESITRLVDVLFNVVAKLSSDSGHACETLQDDTVRRIAGSRHGHHSVYPL